MSHPVSTQSLFLIQQKKHIRTIRIARIMILLIFFGLWEIASDLKWIDSFIFSSPSKVAQCFFQLLLHQHLLYHIGVTLMETFLSFALVLLLTLLITTSLWLSDKISKTLEPYLVVLNSLPKSALAPLLIVWLGANYKTIILTGMSVAIFGSILNLYTAFMEMDPEKIKLVQTLGGNKKDILLKVMIPGNIPSLLSIMKVNIGLCLVGVIIGEFIAAKIGLGYLIIYGSQVFRLLLLLILWSIPYKKSYFLLFFVIISKFNAETTKASADITKTTHTLLIH